MNSLLPTVELKKAPVSSDVELVLLFQDAKTKTPYQAVVDKLKKAKAFTGRAGSQQFLRFGGKGKAANALIIGLGDAKTLDREALRNAGAAAWQKLKAEKTPKAFLNVDGLGLALSEKGNALSIAEATESFLEGLYLIAYKWVGYRSDKKSDADDFVLKLTLTGKGAQDRDLKQAAKNAAAVGEAVTITRNWSNEPSNYGTPEFYAAEAKKLSTKYGLKLKVLNAAEIKKEKMNLLWSVSAGSDREPRVVVLEYTPERSNGKTLALVGKGVTFDSGGISLKPGSRMEEMKHDMTGAATVAGAVVLAALWKVPTRVVAIMGFTENMPGGDATQPSNVITARNGKTVEILNTDAEGRLVLADLLDYANEFKPTAIVNAATLTGAVGVALGKQACAIFANDDALLKDCEKAANRHRERMWQLPLWDEYFEEMKSDSADMRNISNDGYAGAIRGAIFLKQFIKKGTPWAHLDIALTAYNVSHLAYMPKRGASGLHVRTLARLAEGFGQ